MNKRINVEKGKRFEIPKKLLEVVGWVREDGTEVMIEHDHSKSKCYEGKEAEVNCYKCSKSFVTTERQLGLFDLFVCKNCYLRYGPDFDEK